MKILKKPDWLKKQLFMNSRENYVKSVINDYNIHTVCREAKCPNIGECYSNKTAAFLLLGKNCTRNCRFCSISENRKVFSFDEGEPGRIAEAVAKLNLKYVVLTSVTRDDLNDGGASVFIETVNEIKKVSKDTLIEVLVPDFQGDLNLIEKIASLDISVFNHNLETVKRLYDEIRPMADYNRSLSILKYVKDYNSRLIIKTGIMVGMGETYDEVKELIEQISLIKIDALTIGQYLPPGKNFYPVKEYIEKNIFAGYREYAEKAGIKIVFSDTFVRSSYLSEKIYLNSNLKI